MPHDVMLYVGHAVEAGEYIQKKVAGISREFYLEDEDLRTIAERKFEVIGEALMDSLVKEVYGQEYDTDSHYQADAYRYIDTFTITGEPVHPYTKSRLDEFSRSGEQGLLSPEIILSDLAYRKLVPVGEYLLDYQI